MEVLKYIAEIHFASPFLMVPAFLVVLVLFYTARIRRRSVPSSYIGFFRNVAMRKTRSPLFWIYRVLPYFLSIVFVLAIGAPVHEEYQLMSHESTPYTFIVDASGSTAALSHEGDVAISFDETVLNTFRLSLMRFIEDRKEVSEFFLFPYSDIPYAARYFAGRKEAEVQILGYLNDLPQEIQWWNQSSSRRFYLQGTHTAFAIEAVTRYRSLLPREYQQGVYVILTDFQDAQISRITASLNSLIESGLERNIYILIMSPKLEDRNLSYFQNNLDHPDQVRVLRVHNRSELDAVLNAIGESESSLFEMTRESIRSESLEYLLIYVLILGTFFFAGLEEFFFRRIP